jgi:hypothetical protein
MQLPALRTASLQKIALGFASALEKKLEGDRDPDRDREN